MRTRLSIFCDKVIEAGWLAAIVVVPLFFNIYSQRVFEPDKISLLRSLVLVMSAAWLVRAIEDWRSGAGAMASLPSAAAGGPALERSEGTQPGWWKRLTQKPLVLPTLLLVLVYIISTILSVAPAVSFLGSYQRLQGTYTTFSYIVLFFLVLDGLRTRRQFDRLVTTAILASFPIALYGLVQHFGLDPLPWGGDVTNRVASNMGNAIFVAAYLIMVVPLTLVRLLKNWKKVTGPFETRDGLWGILAFALLAVCLLAAMMVRQDAGSSWIVWVALAVGLGLQVPVYLLNPAERRTRLLAISLPLTFAFLLAFSWLQEVILPPPEGVEVPGHMWLGILAALIFVAAMIAFAYYLRRPISRLLLFSTYFIVLIAQLICIFYTQSRGPLLGLLAGLFVFVAALGLLKRKVGLTWAVFGAYLSIIAFLVVFNTANTPLIEKLRETRYIGRLGKVLQTEEGTGKVRVLIWEGVIDMITPHDPLVTPGAEGGPDSANALRPLIGYGPESMYVAYNRFYPADLAHYEKRNASPDRSHNETFDALAQTGIVGFLVYMLAFASVFYYALKFLGLMRAPWQRWAFLGLWIGGGIAGALLGWLWGGPVYLGVGIPGGVIILGLGGYLLLVAGKATADRAFRESLGGGNVLWGIALLSAVTAHFVEIHFGIAIASTRTYFWVYAALLAILGTRFSAQPSEGQPVPVGEPVPQALASGRAQSVDKSQASAAKPQTVKGKPQPSAGKQTTARRKQPSAISHKPSAIGHKPSAISHLPFANDWWGTVVLWTLLAILILGTMLFDYVTVQDNATGALDTIWRSLTRRDGAVSPIMLVVFLVVWATVGLVGLAELAARHESKDKGAQQWLSAAGVYLGGSFLGVLLFGLLHAVRIRPVTLTAADATNPLPNTASYYYIVLLLAVAALAWALTFLFRRPAKAWRWSGKPADAVLLASAIALPVIAIVLLVVSNLGIVRADIMYKQGLSSEKAGDWEGAIYFYQKAIEVAPDQDYYYLFLGRALMEKGRATGTENPDAWFAESELALGKAREIAPLNTDHSANLGRLYRTWGGLGQEPQRTERLNRALVYYADATALSPQNVQLLNEYAQTYLALGQKEAALTKFEQSLALDKKYTQTYLLLGEYYLDGSQWAEAVDAYQGALGVSSRSTEALSSLGYAYSQQGKMDEALEAYERAVELSPRNFGYRKNLAILYQQMGLMADALREAEEALALAPDSQKEAMESYVAQLRAQNTNLSAEDAAKVQQFIDQGRAQMEAEEWAAAIDLLLQAVALDPGNVPAHSALAYAYAKENKVAEAIAENLAVLEVLPDDYSSSKNLALLYQQQGETDKAIAAAQTALAAAPDEDKAVLEAFLEELGVSTSEPAPTPGAQTRAGDLLPEERNNMFKSYPEMTVDPAKSYQATIVTAKGNIVLELYPGKAPLAVNSFVFLAREGYFDHTTFHRVLTGFMAQGGDPLGTGTGGPGYQFANEIDSSLHFDSAGVLAMANAGPNTNGSQFFITYAAASWLDGGYTIFGRLTAGLDVLQALTPRDPQKNPKFVGDEILTIEIEEK